MACKQFGVSPKGSCGSLCLNRACLFSSNIRTRALRVVPVTLIQGRANVDGRRPNPSISHSSLSPELEAVTPTGVPVIIYHRRKVRLTRIVSRQFFLDRPNHLGEIAALLNDSIVLEKSKTFILISHFLRRNQRAAWCRVVERLSREKGAIYFMSCDHSTFALSRPPGIPRIDK